ncbi:hypothetical protein ACWJJH_16085 [Endozoicomonadaceae bacterium StTr2]
MSVSFNQLAPSRRHKGLVAILFLVMLVGMLFSAVTTHSLQSHVMIETRGQLSAVQQITHIHEISSTDSTYLSHSHSTPHGHSELYQQRSISDYLNQLSRNTSRQYLAYCHSLYQQILQEPPERPPQPLAVS